MEEKGRVGGLKALLHKSEWSISGGSGADE